MSLCLLIKLWIELLVMKNRKNNKISILHKSTKLYF